ncbi:DNA methyltransferase [Leuconostoc falkenbergense]|uniref:DNA methyltransferase n=1 Tax=Leuconostoc falkenbergense TaxID=2766470 RepID=UPI0002738979|nr:DNA methyltransferase [Leuconostoc falkenbergense]OQJ71339.1 type III restriction endonuclease subunit M [Leuconostoc pseudomesenteroides]OQJ80001.1 type III restriction endonuclease subunit M [Leuconostoc pseudomesenteroides]ORI86088.1 type III restriction endonuclease subunit M [Leuconostoc pseudomesenteroides]CCJ67487.1 Type III restriction-modification system methylation subunit [Leuconostoc pseudomesenteroides 4882]
MIDSKIMETTKSILKDFGNTYFSDKGTLRRNKVIEDLDAYTPMLMKALLANQLIHDTYTESIVIDDKNVELFKLNQFIEMFTYKEYWQDSYTKFENKIGLTAGGKFIDETADVVLDFPFKDTVLKAGMTKEDQKDANEPFLHETIARSEIDQLLEPKIFVNVTKYDQESLDGASTDNFDDDNLIIKGNNLIALHSLKNRFSGKIKTIYIDPPYYFEANKKEDTFKYNSNFKLSTWLVFMKNRLEVARDLLSPDGAIFVQISDDGVAEVHRLLKEIFNKSDENNFINKITVKTKSPSGFASVNAGVFETAEYILAFAKNKKQWTYNQQFVEASYDENYKFYIPNKEESYKNWNILNLFDFIAEKQGFTNKRTAIKELGRAAFHEMVAGFALENKDKVFRYTAIGNNAGADIVIARDTSKKSPDDIISMPREKYYDVYIRNGSELAFYSKKVRAIDGVDVPSIQLSNIWMDVPYEGIAKEGGVTLKGGKKPEKLIRRILEMSSNPGDIVLDFHLGSGTTASVAHKLQRKYIGLEQLEIQIVDIKNRLQYVIAGEQGGISKDVNWQGGGSFVYAELMEKNQGYLKDVQQAETTKQLEDVVNRMMVGGADFDFQVDVEEVLQDPEYQAMALADKKQLMVKVIDKNQLYYAYSDMEDRDVQELMSESDIAFNKSFYGERDL